MGKKQIIQIVIVIAAFSGAFIVLYKGGVFGSPAANQAMLATSNPADLDKPILPYGDSLDFKVIDTGRFHYNQFQFENLDPNDVGVEVPNLISAPVSSGSVK